MRPIRYQATIHNVREVILVGAADSTFWEQKLAAEDLAPFLIDGKAQATITAITSTFRGLRFEEMSIALAVCEHANAATPAGFFLVHAFNSRRLFALAERVFLRTPYYPGAIAVQEGSPARARLTLAGQPVFDAAMSGARAPLRSGEDWWEGAIYLPRRFARGQGQGERFFARMGGHTAVYPFLPESDRCQMRPRKDDDALRWLIESNFTPHEWRLRGQATHARSRTGSRTAQTEVAT